METEIRFYPPPSAPYFFENSKRFQGRSLEDLLFTQSASFFSIAHQPHHEGDRMHRHIKFLLTVGDNLETKIICPFCKTETIKFFLLLNNHLVHQKLTCCANEACRKALKAGHGDDMLIALKVRNLGMKILRTRTLRRKAEMLFRQALGLKPKSSPQAVFDAVSAKYLGYFAENLGEVEVSKKEESVVLREPIKKEKTSFRQRMSKMSECYKQQLRLEL